MPQNTGIYLLEGSRVTAGLSTCYAGEGEVLCGFLSPVQCLPSNSRTDKINEYVVIRLGHGTAGVGLSVDVTCFS